MSEDLEKSAPISETESNNEQNVPEDSTENQAEPVEEQVAEQTSEANIQEEPQAEPQAYAPAEQQAYSQTEPQIIIQRERGFAHYVGFAILAVLCICFFFIPGIAVTFGVSLIPGVALGAMAAWIFSTIISVTAWLVFKMKIQGFKKSFYWYIGLCILVFALLVAIEVMTDVNVFAKILALLTGADAV